MTRARIAVNVLAFQGAWSATVGAAAAGRPWIGPVVAAVLVASHLALAAHSALLLPASFAIAARCDGVEPQPMEHPHV